MRRTHAALVSLLLVLLAAPLSLSAQEKPRIAIMPFDYATVQTSVSAIFGTNQDIGKGIVDMLTDKLVNDGTYRLVDRAAMQKILAEQNFANSNRADPTSASKLGKLLGVNIIVVGDITQFGNDDKHYGGSGAGGDWWSRGAGALAVKKSKAVVGITARMIDVNTGEILASSMSKGESKRSGLASSGGGGSGWKSGGGGVDMGSSNFQDTIIGEATKASVDDLAVKLEASAAKLPAPAPPPAAVYSGLVADASGNDITINVGTSAGARVGDKLTVLRTGRVIKDPATGKPLRSIDTTLGQITLTSVDEGSAVGTFSGTGPVKVGDKVKTP